MEREIRQVQFNHVEKPKLKRVAAYARVSSGKDAMLHSLSAQVSYYSEYIQKHSGWIYVGVYADEALSGTKDNRGEFCRLIDDCKNGRIDMVITKSISRFARNTVTLLETVRELKSIDVDVYFEEQNIHSTSGDGEMMLTILASFAQEESLSASENCKWRIRKGFQEGELINLRQLYGYDICKDSIKINQNQAEVVRLIFSLFMQGYGTYKIAEFLNNLKIPSFHEKEWRHNVICRMLKNEKYTGNALLQQTYSVDHLSKKRAKNTGQLNMYFAKNTHPAIISKSKFNMVQIELQKRAQKNNVKDNCQSRYPFSSKIICDNCGKHYVRRTMHANDKYKRVYWNCSTYLRKSKKACYTKQIPEDILEKIAADVLGVNNFDTNVFEKEIKAIHIQEFFKLKFVFNNGKVIEREWTYQ